MSVGSKIALSTTLKFIPLILYWSITSEWGMILGAAISVLILSTEIATRKHSLLSMFTTAYLLLVNSLYFGFGQHYLFDKRHLISYLALAVFGLISVILDKPYTMYEARKSYADEFGVSHLFIEVNILITKIWIITYTLAAIIRTLGENSFVVIIPNILIAVAIFLSIKIPNLMPEA